MMETIARDRLAADRTQLANERTLLAYVRTSLALVLAGASAWHFFGTFWLDLLGGFLVSSGVSCVGYGVYRFNKIKQLIHRTFNYESLDLLGSGEGEPLLKSISVPDHLELIPEEVVSKV